MSDLQTRLAIEAPSAPLDAEDRQLVDLVDRYLRRGLDLERWWDERGVHGRFEDRFELAFTYNRPDTSFGFFDTATVDGEPMPVLGNYQGMFYDQPKSGVAARTAAADRINREIRQFVLRYFMRVSDFRDPQPYTEGEPEPPPFLGPLSWCFRDDTRIQGFGYSQLYYKRRDTGEVGKFPEERRSAIVDLREIGPTYDWIVVKVQIFDFKFVFDPFGLAAPSLSLPLEEASYLVLSPSFIRDDQERNEEGVDGPDGRSSAEEIGHYGLGYAFIKNPGNTLLAWGPGKFDAAFQTIDFHVLADGRIRVGMVFVANRPRRLANIPVDPVAGAVEMSRLLLPEALLPLTAPAQRMTRSTPWSGLSFDPLFPSLAVLNAMTFGFSGRQLCMTRQQIEKRLILTHFEKHYGTLLGSLQTWRQIRDWLDERTLPRWVITGESV